MKEKIKILIVEDEPLVAEDIAGHLETVNFTVTGIAYSGEQAIEMLENNLPDAVLLDITLGTEIDGIAVAHLINSKYSIPFVFLTSHSDRGTIERVKATRPAGYLLKPFDENDLLTSLEIALFNHMNRRPQGIDLTIENINQHVPTALSEREFEILNLVRQGKTNKEISEAVFLSVNTIKTHLVRIYQKLDVKNRTEIMFKLNKLLSR
ncbi:MAG: DNA-binding NarL/FixJ family response regulator [Flavobacteriales bacterium]|jgi:DNA-binding NarL/FixJ family response regulator